MALLSRWGYEADGQTSALGGQRNLRIEASGKHVSTIGRARFGLFTTWAAHLANSPWQVKNTPPFRTGDPTFMIFQGRTGVVDLLRGCSSKALADAAWADVSGSKQCVNG